MVSNVAAKLGLTLAGNSGGLIGPTLGRAWPNLYRVAILLAQPSPISSYQVSPALCEKKC